MAVNDSPSQLKQCASVSNVSHSAGRSSANGTVSSLSTSHQSSAKGKGKNGALLPASVNPIHALAVKDSPSQLKQCGSVSNVSHSASRSSANGSVNSLSTSHQSSAKGKEKNSTLLHVSVNPIQKNSTILPVSVNPI